jgi:membrane protein implicated in regulation of membrane protease activity
MALSYKARRRWSLFILVIGLPAYIAAVWFLLSLLEGWPVWLQIVICLLLSVVWAFPLRSVFLGVGQADPDAPRDE